MSKTVQTEGRRIAIMQPYFFPYIGYFQLMHAVDTFVVFDDVNYIRRGWINRNNILGNNMPQLISLQTSGASQNKLINEVNVGENQKKILKTIEHNYKKAPQFVTVFPLIAQIMGVQEKNLAKFLILQLQEICRYLHLEPSWYVSSDLAKNQSLTGQDRLIGMCNSLGASHYINAIGGKDLYQKDAFQAHDIQLSFLKPNQSSYPQFNNNFVPFLSIIDILMFNDLEACRDILRDYSLVR